MFAKLRNKLAAALAVPAPALTDEMRTQHYEAVKMSMACQLAGAGMHHETAHLPGTLIFSPEGRAPLHLQIRSLSEGILAIAATLAEQWDCETQHVILVSPCADEGGTFRFEDAKHRTLGYASLVADRGDV